MYSATELDFHHSSFKLSLPLSPSLLAQEHVFGICGFLCSVALKARDAFWAPEMVIVTLLSCCTQAWWELQKAINNERRLVQPTKRMKSASVLSG